VTEENSQEASDGFTFENIHEEKKPEPVKEVKQ